MTDRALLTFKYRLLPTRQQRQALNEILEFQRQLYNAALEERIGCYRRTGRTISYMDQCKSLTVCRRALPDMAAIPLNIQRWTVKRLDDAYKAFFRRLRDRAGKVGFPRFRGRDGFDSFGFNEFSGIRIDGRRIRFAGLPGSVRIHLHRPLPADADIRSCVFRRQGRKWSVCFQVRTAVAAARPGATAIGVDLGLTSLAALSDGTLIPNIRPAQATHRHVRVAQRALARCRKNSARRRRVKERLARARAKVANTRTTYLHQVSADLVKRFDLIAVEKLNVKGLAGGMLAKSVHDAGWGRLREFIRYKAAKAGGAMIEVDPRHTSQICPDCGQIEAKALSQRIHRCDCGCVLDRDVAAARVILSRAVMRPGAVNVAHQGERGLGNLVAVLS